MDRASFQNSFGSRAMFCWRLVWGVPYFRVRVAPLLRCSFPGVSLLYLWCSVISPLFDLWSKLVGQVFQPSPTSRTPTQLTTRLRISLLGLAESCVYLKGKAKYLKGNPIQISGAPFLCSFPLHVTVHHKFP